MSVIGIVEIELLPSAAHHVYNYFRSALCRGYVHVCACVHYKRICVQNFIACRPKPFMLNLLVQSIERHSFVLMLVTSVVTK